MSRHLKKGAGFRILTGTVTSPTLAAQIQEFLDCVSRRRNGTSMSPAGGIRRARVRWPRSASR